MHRMVRGRLFVPAAAVPTSADQVAKEHKMTEEHKREQKPWYPKIEREPELNPFVSPQHRSDELDKPVSLADPEDDESEAEAGTPS
jgi:hypothetical protein